VKKIPMPVIAVVSEVLARKYSHARIDDFIRTAGIQGEPPNTSKIDKVRHWLRHANENNSDPFAILGHLIAELMEVDDVNYEFDADEVAYPGRERVQKVLAEHALEYQRGGYIVRKTETTVSSSFEGIIRSRNLGGLQIEFDRISANVNIDPAAAVTASCALLESLFKIYISVEKLEMPSDKTIKPLWNVVRRHLKLEPDREQNDDVRAVLVGLGSIVEGLGSLRTHKGSAHGHEKHTYRMKPRHARLASHAAFTLANFILESWDERRT
jgi:hypothetical protein